MYLALSLTERGEFVEAILHGQEAVEIAETAGQPYNVVLGCVTLAFPYFRQGSFGDAIRVAERGVSVARMSNVRFLLPVVGDILGSAYRATGRLREALALLEEAADLVAGLWVGGPMIALGEGYLAAGRVDEAASLALRVLTLATERKSRGERVRALWLLGEASAARDLIDAQQAEDYFRQALTDATELGMRPLVAHCHLGLSKPYRCTGKRDQAQEHLTIATTMYRAMDMRFWLEQAEAETRNSL
jgi:tetratricopeptide (TPR) repeat protein